MTRRTSQPTAVQTWCIVLDAPDPPTCGDWVAVNGLCPGEEETARFLFLDGTEASGFTFVDEPQAQRDKAATAGQVRWLDFPDCMEIVGVARQDWRPPSWPHDKTLWRLTLASLPSNGAFERRLQAGQTRNSGLLNWPCLKQAR